MANTYTQIHIQAVFAVQNRECIIRNSWKEELYKYISGIVQGNNHKLLSPDLSFLVRCKKNDNKICN